MNEDLEINYLPILTGRSRTFTSILDYGCGAGRITRWLFEKGFRQVRSVDSDLEKVSQLVGASEASGPHQLIQKFDVIILKDVLYYFNRADLLHILEQFRLKLLTDGQVIIQIPNAAILTGQYSYLKDPEMRWALTDRAMIALMESAGFANVKVHPVRFKWNSPKRILFYSAQTLWFQILRLVYWLERGEDDQRPQHFSKSIIIEASRD